jgi:hypothetical protein
LRHASTVPGRRAATALALLTFALPAAAQIVNGSFEDAPDHLNGWTLGPGVQVEALQQGNFAPNTIPVPDGVWYALVSSGPGNAPSAPGGDFDANGVNDFDGSTLGTTFTTVLANESLSFEWAFLTDELGPGGQGQLRFDDLFEVTVDGVSVLRGSVNKPGGVSPYPDTVPYDGLGYTVSSSGPTNGSDFGTDPAGGSTPFQRVCIDIANPGVHTLEFFVADQGDTIYDSALLVDRVELGSGCNPTQVTNSSGELLEVKGGGFVFTTVSNSRPAMSGNGGALAFGSNGDYNGDNPNLQEQIWVATPNGTTYDIARVTAAVGADFGDPAISGGGQWLTFASNGDLVPPGNSDGNHEIFRHGRSSGAFLQITDTAGCTNRLPSINDDGSRIAFVSDCDLGFGATGEEIAFWDGTFRGIDTSGCQSRDPRISRDAAGRYVTFITHCDGPYPGLSNPDGGAEIVQWDTQTDVYLQITDTPAGFFNDTASPSADGRFVAFISSADHEAGENPTGAVVPFRYDRVTDSFLQLADPDPLALFSFAAIDDTGELIAVERLDVVAETFDLFVIEAATPRTLLAVVSGAPNVINGFPAVTLAGNQTVVAFQSDGDYSGNNPDGNLEIWTVGSAVDPPGVAILCSTPNLAIPDRNSQGVTDVIKVPTSGSLVDLDVSVLVEHSFVGDLRVELRHLDTGTTANIIARPGRPPGAGCAGDDCDATLDDEAASTVERECVTPGPVAIQGNFRPNQVLSRFDGEDMFGDWQLRVSDRARANTGTFVEWCLIPSTP